MFVPVCVVAAVALTGRLARAEDDVAQAAKAVFEQHCVRCHGLEQKVDGLDLRDLAGLTTTKGSDERLFITPGKPDESLVWSMLADGQMPPSDRPQPSAEEKQAVQFWIEAGAPNVEAESTREPVTLLGSLELIEKHQRQTPSHLREFQRYFTLANLHNNSDLSTADLNLARAALSKVLNSLSLQAEIVLPVSLDPQQTLFAIDLRDFGWHQGNAWQNMLAHYPYGIDYSTHRDRQVAESSVELAEDATTNVYLIRGDWFIARATRSPVYDAFLELGDDLQALQTKLGVDLGANFKFFRLARGGVFRSGVSKQNRLLERHPGPFGAYWISYDFLPDNSRRDLSKFPLGPAFEGNPFSAQSFVHDGNEVVVHLPNGMLAYFLCDAEGKAIAEGPTKVVSDARSITGRPEIVNAISCMACHKTGFQPFTDQIQATTTLMGEPLDAVSRLFPSHEEMDRLLAQDTARFKRAAEQATGPFLQVGPDAGKDIFEFPEPVGAVAERMYYAPLNMNTVAAELIGWSGDGPTLQEMIESGNSLRTLLAPFREEGGSMPRIEWDGGDDYSADGTLTRMQKVMREMRLGTPTSADR